MYRRRIELRRLRLSLHVRQAKRQIRVRVCRMRTKGRAVNDSRHLHIRLWGHRGNDSAVENVHRRTQVCFTAHPLGGPTISWKGPLTLLSDQQGTSEAHRLSSDRGFKGCENVRAD